MTISTVSFIGSGNLATHLSKALYAGNIRIVDVYSLNFGNAEKLALEVGARAVHNIGELQPVDLIIICVTDSAIAQVSNSLKNQNIVVHTSGSTSINVLSKHQNYGVLYPFQTFSKETDLDFSNVPVFIESNSSSCFDSLNNLAKTVTGEVYALNTEQRLRLHLAAVFACNFSNHMYSIAHDILRGSDLPFGILSQLINETATKATGSGEPANVQTGPAVRNNLNIMEHHKEILAFNPLWQKIYTFVSNSIIERETERKNGTF